MDRKELISRTGSLLQIGGATPFIYDDGRGKGTSAYRVRTGTGLDFTVLRDRALDVFECFYKGVNLALITRNGLVSPERLSTRFGQNMSGGLFFTAGLRNTGAEAEGFPQHGRVHLLPACDSYAKTEFEDGFPKIEICGDTYDSSFSDTLCLHRRLVAFKNEISVFDEIENMTAADHEYAVLYHLNLAYPFIDENARILCDEKTVVTPSGDRSREALADHLRFAPPENVPGCNYLLDVPADASGYATVRVENPSVGFGVYITARKDTLPYFNEWKSVKPGIYTLAIEPSSTRLRGILEERKQGGMGVIPPFESASLHFRFGVYDL